MRSVLEVGRGPSERDTKAQLVETAERLFACYGLEGVSLRQIATAAGSSNPGVVQYHFGDKQGLLRSIFAYRLSALEARRGALLAEAQRAKALNDARVLLQVLLGPVGEVRDQEGRRSYAAFLLRLHNANLPSARAKQDLVFSLAPLAEHITNLIRAAVPPMPEALFDFRQQAASALYWQALVDLDTERRREGGVRVAEEAVLAEALDLGAGLLTAPVSARAAAAFEAGSASRAGSTDAGRR
ncbi:MAG: TetR/AcrR family transcriptional regulator [Caulobacteraceae bacterium]|nr:TetR/AcrR family transcriptional regulator [Caulobacteraceae bacterium]